jgi:ABC-type microcin C transport system permease subunit YejB
MSFEKLVVIGFVSGIATFALLLIFVFATGSTFGQRCTAMGYSGDDWSQCVDGLSRGEEDF